MLEQIYEWSEDVRSNELSHNGIGVSCESMSVSGTYNTTLTYSLGQITSYFKCKTESG